MITAIKNSLTDNWLSLLIVVVIVAAFVILRTKPTELADAAAFDQAITAGHPTIVEFYSNY